MKVLFATQELADLYEESPDNITGKQRIPHEVLRQYHKKVIILESISELRELYNFRSLNFEALKGDRKGQFSIRLNQQYRLIFTINRNGELEILIIEISKHYE